MIFVFLYHLTPASVTNTGELLDSMQRFPELKYMANAEGVGIESIEPDAVGVPVKTTD